MVEHLLFRFDASSELGLGHAFRCMALIEYIKINSNQHPVKCVVIAKALPLFLKTKLIILGALVERLPNALNNQDELLAIGALNRHYQSKVLVLDGYQFAGDYRQRLACLNLKIVNFDDTNDLPELFCDVLINALPFADTLGYQDSAPQAKHLLGLQYSIIRQEFLTLTATPFTKRKCLLVNFGGSDIGGLTLPVLQQLAISHCAIIPDNVLVVTGGGCKNIGNISAFCQQTGYRHIHNCTDMACLLAQSRMAICAPGAIVYELAYSQVPSVFLTVADNQLLSAKAHQDAGWCYVYNGRVSEQVKLAVKQATLLWQDQAQLVEMSKIAATLIDGQGVKRIVNNITVKLNE